MRVQRDGNDSHAPWKGRWKGLWLGLGLTLGMLSLGTPGPAWAADARVVDRTVLQPGIWWDPSHSGHGFELQQIGQQVYVLWYTYDQDGKAIWYAGQGTRQDGSVTMDLVRHHWDGARIDSSTPVGHLRLEFNHREEARAQWTVQGGSDTWLIKPFEVNGTLPEINHSGLWYQPERPGYGLSLMVQGDVRIGALYFYDDRGEPTWMFGHTEDGGTAIPLEGFVGPCPGCTGQLGTGGTGALLELSLGSETELSFQIQGTPVQRPPWPAQGARLQPIAPTFSARAADWQLAHFTQDAQLKRWLELANEGRQRPLSTVDFSSPPAPRTYSPTNLQEAGVDEASRVKTDGNWIYTWAADALGAPLPQLRVAQVNETGLFVEPPVALSMAGAQMYQPGLFLTPDRLVAIVSTQPRAASGVASVWVDQRAWTNGSTRIEMLDRSQPGAPASVWKAEIEGHLLASRRIGDQLYVVTRASVLVPDLRLPANSEEDRAHNRAVFERTPLSAMLPHARWNGQQAEPLVETQRVYLPPESAIGRHPEFISVTRIHLTQPEQRETLSILGQASAVYVSSQNLYVAGNRFPSTFFTFNGWWVPEFAKTDIHQIALSPAGMQVRGTGTVEGYLDRDADRAPLRFAERDGHVHVVTVSPTMWGALGRNRLTILSPSRVQPGLLATRAILPSKARPQPLGKPGEMLYATRYVDNRLYAVTFQTTDPLYSVDLSNPADPYIRGALEIPGFSDYLHPLPNGLLLGLGLDARASDGGPAFFQGLQVSLFDINEDAPRELQRVLIGKRGSGSAALRHHHGLVELDTAAGRILAFPARIHDTNATVPPNPPDHYMYPHAWSGVLRFGLTGSSAADARLHTLPPLISRTQEAPDLPSILDDAAVNGRPLLFEHGTAYVDWGRFYWMDRNGTQSGPY